MMEVVIGLFVIISVSLVTYQIGALVMKFAYPKRYGKPDDVETFLAGIVVILIVTLLIYGW